MLFIIHVLYLKAHQLGRDGGDEAIVFVTMYLPCKKRGEIKRFGFGKNAKELGQAGFVKNSLDSFQQHWIQKNGMLQIIIYLFN